MDKVTVGRFIAIEPIPDQKVEAKIEGGIARAAAHAVVVITHMVMDYKPSFSEKDEAIVAEAFDVILPGEAQFQPWNRKESALPDGTKFVLCPIEFVIGFLERQ